MILIGSIFIANKMSWQGDDFSIFSINEDKVEIINISPERGMINVYEINNVDLWIPNGMGWYPVSRLNLIVKGDKELAKKIAFYNFGFVTKKVVIGKDWNKNDFLWSNLGPGGWLRYRLTVDEWLWKSETLSIENLDEFMPRDMADSKILSADIKINVINATGKNGFGNMMADRLEWFGLTVTSVQTRDVEKSCQIYFDFSKPEKEIINNLAGVLECKINNRVGMTELVLGTDMEEMLKYSQTYVRAF